MMQRLMFHCIRQSVWLLQWGNSPSPRPRRRNPRLERDSNPLS